MILLPVGLVLVAQALAGQREPAQQEEESSMIGELGERIATLVRSNMLILWVTPWAISSTIGMLSKAPIM